MNVISPDDLACGLLNGAALKDAHVGAAPLNGVLPVYKEWGDTPLQTHEKLRAQHPSLVKATLSYAGRLDPLAEGLMLVLVGEANKEREKYLGLSKQYEVEVLFEINTDTGDIFGIPKIAADSGLSSMTEDFTRSIEQNFDTILNSFLGKHQFEYPLYSSKTVQGKALHQWVNEGRINEIEIPKTDVEIFSIKNLGIRHVQFREILEKVQKAVKTVRGDFRFEQIESAWKNILINKNKSHNENERDDECTREFLILKIECECSSGTYMRTLAEEIGKKSGTVALAYSIKRTKVGEIRL
jgi:tRNA pseudouridine(55) synthase